MPGRNVPRAGVTEETTCNFSSLSLRGLAYLGGRERNNLSKGIWGTTLTIQCLRLHVSTAGSVGSIPRGRTRISHDTQCGQKKKGGDLSPVGAWHGVEGPHLAWGARKRSQRSFRRLPLSPLSTRSHKITKSALNYHNTSDYPKHHSTNKYLYLLNWGLAGNAFQGRSQGSFLILTWVLQARKGGN